MTAAMSGLPDLLSDVRAGVDEMADVVDTIAAAAGRLARAMPTTAARTVATQLDRMRALEQEAVTRIGEVLACAGDPDALWAAGRAWVDDIGASVGRLAGETTLDRLRADDHWQGVAAEAYRNTLRPQSDALAAVTAAADEIDAVLVELGEAILEFWVAVAGALASLVAAGLAAAAEAASVVALPLAIATVIAGLGTFVAFLDDAIAALTSITGTSRTRAAELQRRVGNDVAFPGGSWPRSTTELTDGSSSDGDDTAWHLR